MALEDSWTPSRRLQAAAAAERERLSRELDRLGLRERELAADLAQTRSRRAELENEFDMLNRFVEFDAAEPPPSGDASPRRLRAVPTPAVDGGEAVLKGVAIREAAVRVLLEHSGPGSAAHYRDWFELVTARGLIPAGKDPVATFLTQIGRSPVVKRSTAAGVYELDVEFPERARRQLADLAEEIAALDITSPRSSVQELASAREARAKLVVRQQQLERQLEEAVRSLESR
jgi:hypothetical protein